MTLSKIILLSIFIAIGASFRNDKFITFNTSSSKFGISVSIASNLDSPFTVKSQILFNTSDSSVTFTPNATQGKYLIEPIFPEDKFKLYNDLNENQYWYSFKKIFNQSQANIIPAFGLAQLTVNNQTTNYVLPLFSMPLSWLQINHLYQCDGVLISFKKTDSVIDLTVFSSKKQAFYFLSKALWGFRQKNQEIIFSRQTFSLESNIQIQISPNKVCILNDKLPKNQKNSSLKSYYTLEELLTNFSTKLELKHKTTEQDL